MARRTKILSQQATIQGILLSGALLLASGIAWSQEESLDDLEESSDDFEEPSDDFEEPDDELSDLDEEEAAVEDETETSPPPPESAASGETDKSGTQLLMGLRYRAVIFPRFLINTFGLQGARTVVAHGVGPEVGAHFGKTSDGFTVLFSPWFVDYSAKPTPINEKGNGDALWEIAESDLKAWYLTVDASWDHKIVDRLSFQLGMGVGLGIVTGNLYRNETYVNNVNPDFPADKDWPNLSECSAPGIPSGACPQGNYGKSEKWPVYPWLNFQTGLTYQPVDQFIGRLDIGIGSSGFWVGLGADYSLFL